MAHDAAHGPESEEESSEKAAEVGNSLLNRRSYMKLSAAAAAAMGTAAATGTAAAATSRHGISFDRVVNAVDDLGWDPGGNQEIDVPTDDGLLIEVPAGEYVFRGSGDNNGPYRATSRTGGFAASATTRATSSSEPPTGSRHASSTPVTTRRGFSSRI